MSKSYGCSLIGAVVRTTRVEVSSQAETMYSAAARSMADATNVGSLAGRLAAGQMNARNWLSTIPIPQVSQIVKFAGSRTYKLLPKHLPVSKFGTRSSTTVQYNAHRLQ